MLLAPQNVTLRTGEHQAQFNEPYGEQVVLHQPPLIGGAVVYARQRM